MCHECNETYINPPCNCGESSLPCKYTGANLPCIGIISGETLDAAISKLSDTICNITPNLPEVVLYTEKALGAGFITTSLTTVTGTSQVVPAGGEGEYEITYIGQYNNPDSALGTLSLRLYKGLVEYNSIVRRTVVGVELSVTPFTLFASNINLVAGDEILIKASATALTFPQNAICKVSKVS